MIPDDTTIYYVFSTIAQTLAAFVGILAAFAVMRLSDLSARLREELPGFAQYCQYQEFFYADLAAGDYAGAVASIDGDAIVGDTDAMVFSACRLAATERQQLIQALRRNLVVTGSVILFSVGSLIAAKPIAASHLATWAVLAAGFLGLAISLVVARGLVPFIARKTSRKKASGRSTRTKKPSSASRPVA